MTPTAALQLRAMTLRGIGSYINGERLDLRPVTILCGTNGSGKSTWFQVLDMLRGSVGKKGFPFWLIDPRSDKRGHEFGYTNAFLATEEDDALDALADVEQDAMFGRPGTIGLEFITRQSLRVGQRAAPRVAGDCELQRFLLRGDLPAGTDIRLRLTVPESLELLQGGPSSSFRRPHEVELVLGRRYVLRFRGDFISGVEFRCSSGLIDETSAINEVSLGEHPLPEIARAPGRLRHGLDPDGLALARMGRARLQCLVRALLNSVFSIGAVRAPQLGERTGRRAQRSRRVRADGSATHVLERSFAEASMRHRREPHAGLVSVEFRESDLLEEWLVRHHLLISEASASDPRLLRILGCMEPAARKELLETRGRPPGIADLEPEPARELQDSWNRRSTRALLEGLNSALASPDLYEKAVWEAPDTAEARAIIDQGVENLSDSERRRLNRLLIEHALRGRGLRRSEGYTFGMWYAWWMRALVRASPYTRIGSRVRLSDLWSSDIVAPSGLLRTLNPVAAAVDGHEEEWGEDEDPQALGRYDHPCFPFAGYQVAPANFSAGFHQIAPIVVQTGLMARGETLTIENPEVHLHPGLQLSLTDFLIEHALDGRTIVVETHSDLLIRRALLAVLEERIPQEQIRIYFAALTDEVAGCRGSRLERLSVNTRGQIENWPDGFLTDDVKESQRLIDILYGGVESAGDSDEEGSDS